MRTAMFGYFISNLVTTLIMTLIWHQNHKKYVGLSLWLVNFILQLVGTFLFLLRDSFPDFVAILISNTCFVLGLIILYEGLARFLAQPVSHRLNAIILAGFLILMTFYTYFQPNTGIRIILESVAVTLVALQCSWLLLRQVTSELMSIARWVGIVFLVYALASISRIFIASATPPPSDFFQIDSLDTIVIFFNQLLIVVITFSLVLMINSRLFRELKTREEALGKSEEKYRGLFERMSSGVAVYQAIGNGEDFVFEDFNRAAEVIECTKREAVIGKRLTEAFPGVKDLGAFSVFQKVWKTGQPEYFPSTVYRDEHDPGTWRENWIYKLASGEIVAIYNDITERKQAEEALMRSEERYRRIVEYANEGIWIIDQESFTSFVNSKMADMLGYTVEEMARRSFFDFMDQEGQQFAEKYVESRKQGISGQHEFKFKRKDGRDLWALLGTCPLLDGEGNYAGAIAMVSDITDLKRIDESLRDALAEKEVLLREVHHRVKNNIQAIIYLVESRLSQVTDEQTGLMLKGIQETARTMGLVYEQLYQSENLSEVGMEHYLNDLVANVVEAFGGRRQIELNLECEDIRLDLGTAMPCGLMVNELLTNALKYAFPPSFQGAPKLMISLKARDNRCDLLVGDNGVGLPEGMEQRTPRSMGLRLVKLWATHQMGGTLEVESGDGTTYHITFPTRNK